MNRAKGPYEPGQMPPFLLVYGGCFEEGIWWVYVTSGKCAVLERLAMVEERKVRIIHGLNISHKELLYLLQNSTSYQSKVLRACS